MRWASSERGGPAAAAKAVAKAAVLGLCVLALLPLAPPAAWAQNQSASVTTRSLRFAKGSSSAVVAGKAAYAQSLVYTLQARADQTMTVTLESSGDAATFSVTAPGAQTLADGFSVTRWKGVLPETGRYEIVLVMNNEQLKRVPYRLKVSIH